MNEPSIVDGWNKFEIEKKETLPLFPEYTCVPKTVLW
jgi:hypothetical protein